MHTSEEWAASEHRAANKAHWDERVGVHVDSRFYDVEGFIGGRCPLHSSDLRLAEDVTGLRLAHLQCHFGMDTLAWARRGAHVTGLDFSPAAIEAARHLAMRSGLPARFVCSDVYDAAQTLGATYDLVVTGVGALVWLPDIRRWASVVASLLAPGGALVLREMHPMLYTIDEQREDGLLAVRYPYFETRAPLPDDSEGSYADASASFEHLRSYCWNHGVAETVQALLDAGLVLERIEELTCCDWEPLPHHSMKRSDGMWALPGRDERLPMVLALRARKPLV